MGLPSYVKSLHELIDLLFFGKGVGPLDETFVALATSASLGEHFIEVVLELSAKDETSPCFWILVFGVIRKSSFASHGLFAVVSCLASIRFLEILESLDLSKSF